MNSVPHWRVPVMPGALAETEILEVSEVFGISARDARAVVDQVQTGFDRWLAERGDFTSAAG